MVNRNKDWYKHCRPFFTQMLPGKITKDYAKKEIETAKGCNCNVLMFFVENEGYTIYNSDFASKDPNVGNQDLLEELIKEAKKAGMKFGASWMGQHCQTELAKKHPDWWLRDKTFSGSEGEMAMESASYAMKGTMCLNSPFRKYLIDEVREVITKYDVDAIYFDGLYAPLGYCYCSYCKTKFKERYGDDIPISQKDPRLFDFRFSTVEDFCKDIRDMINEYSPEVIFVEDTHGTLIGYCDSGEPVWRTSKYVDVYILECYWDVIKEPAYYVGMECRLLAAETKKTVWSPRWIARNPDRNYVCIPPESVKLWVIEALLNGASPTCVDQNVFKFDRTAYPAVKQAFGHVRALERYIRNAKPIKYAALLHSLDTKFLNLPDHSRDERKFFEGFYKVMLENHIPFTVITEKDVLNDHLSEYKTLILPNTYCMSNAVVDKITDYVKKGGGLVATYLTSIADEKGNKRQDMALGQLLGLKFKGTVSRGQRGDKEPVTYYRMKQKHLLTKGLGDNTYSFKGSLALIEVSKNSNIIFNALDFDKEAKKEGGYFVWFPGKPSNPLIIVREDKGRIVYFAGALDGAYWEDGLPEAGRLLTNAVEWSGCGKIPIKVDCPKTVEVAIYENSDDNSFVILMGNFSTNQMYATGFPGQFVENPQPLDRTYHISCVVPINDIKITVNIGKNRPKKIASITGQKLHSVQKGGKIIINVPQLKEYEAIVIK